MSPKKGSALPSRSFVIALAGQPNVGKSTIFNLLTGLHQHVGNWPGKTVERKEGDFSWAGHDYHLVDLPGTYSLTANSSEELIAREFILHGRPDIVIAVVNASILERSLYLVAELLPMSVPLVIALNMMDVAEQEGFHIEPEVLQAALGVRVVPMQAAREKGIRELMQAIDDTIQKRVPYAPRQPEIRADHREVLSRIVDLIREHVPPSCPVDWTAQKLLEGDSEVTEMMNRNLAGQKREELNGILRAHDDAFMAVAAGRYEWISRLVRAAMTIPRSGPISRTLQLDRWLAHPWWGLLALAAVMAAVFSLTYMVGIPLQELLHRWIVQNLQHLVGNTLAQSPWWMRGLLADGLIGGVGTLFTFLPILVMFFSLMALLEDVGYLARAAFVMDGYMHVMGLHGKSCLPLFLGFGCNVPAVLGTRVIESTPVRLLTIFLVPLVPCTGRMAVVAFLAPVFFGRAAFLVTAGLIALSLVILVLSGMAAGRFFFRQERAAFIMELPLYHFPNLRTIGMLVWQRTGEFIRKAFLVILPVSLVIWALSRLPAGNVESSLLAHFSRWLEPAGRLLGFDWRLLVALFASFIAKENSLATLGVLFQAGGGSGLSGLLAAAYSRATGLAFLSSQLLFIPCAATVAAIRQESGSWRRTLFQMSYLLLLSCLVGIAVYRLTLLLGLG